MIIIKFLLTVCLCFTLTNIVHTDDIALVRNLKKEKNIYRLHHPITVNKEISN